MAIIATWTPSELPSSVAHQRGGTVVRSALGVIAGFLGPASLPFAHGAAWSPSGRLSPQDHHTTDGLVSRASISQGRTKRSKENLLGVSQTTTRPCWTVTLRLTRDSLLLSPLAGKVTLTQEL
jgi:hypothetical protein